MYQRDWPAEIGSPRFAERVGMSRSPRPKFGSGTLPPTAARTYRRFSVPPTQRTHWPKTVPAAIELVPCSRIVVAVGFSPAVVKASVGLESVVLAAPWI